MTSRQEFREKVREIKLAARREKEVNDMKLQFFTNISHDLRTPLTLIITPVENLLNTVKDADLQHTLGIVYRNAKNLFGLVNQILDFRKLEKTSTQLHLTQGDIVGFVREILQSFQLMAEEQRLILSMETEEEKIEMAFDKDKVGKVLNNLLSNAIKYTSAPSTAAAPGPTVIPDFVAEASRLSRRSTRSGLSYSFLLVFLSLDNQMIPHLLGFLVA